MSFWLEFLWYSGREEILGVHMKSCVANGTACLYGYSVVIELKHHFCKVTYCTSWCEIYKSAVHNLQLWLSAMGNTNQQTMVSGSYWHGIHGRYWEHCSGKWVSVHKLVPTNCCWSYCVTSFLNRCESPLQTLFIWCTYYTETLTHGQCSTTPPVFLVQTGCGWGQFYKGKNIKPV